MSAGPALRVRTAERPGGERPSEDRIFQTPNAVVVLDGATQAFALERDGAWIADELGGRLADGLIASPDADLVPLLERCLADLIDSYDLVPGEAPSTTVNIVRLNADRVDVLVLCDSPVIVLDRSGQVHEIRDDRLAAASASVLRPSGLRDMTDPRWIKAAEDFEALRNHPDGFWVPSATTEAARHSIERSFPVNSIDAILAMSDGVSAGVDDYRIPASWIEAIQLANEAPERLVALVHETEASDPNADRWPRTKRHDDKALAVITIDR